MARRGTRYVFQDKRVFTRLTVRENIQLAAYAAGVPLAPAIDRVLQIRPNIARFLDPPAGGLSGGQRQLLLIGRALVGEPRLLLIDEPTEGLAPVIVQALTQVLARLRSEGGLSIVLVEQNSRVALDFCERTMVMDRGQIVYDGPAERLRRDPETLASLIAAQ